MSAPRINKLVIIGVGLIGGSFALALKKAKGCCAEARRDR
jgi:prephenate dehydrogenase